MRRSSVRIRFGRANKRVGGARDKLQPQGFHRDDIRRRTYRGIALANSVGPGRGLGRIQVSRTYRVPFPRDRGFVEVHREIRCRVPAADRRTRRLLRQFPILPTAKSRSSWPLLAVSKELTDAFKRRVDRDGGHLAPIIRLNSLSNLQGPFCRDFGSCEFSSSQALFQDIGNIDAILGTEGQCFSRNLFALSHAETSIIGNSHSPTLHRRCRVRHSNTSLADHELHFV